MSLHLKEIDRHINGILLDDFSYSKTIDIQTRNASGIEWRASGILSTFGTSGSISAAYLNPGGVSLENFRVKTDGRVLAKASLKVLESTNFTACIEDGRQEPGKSVAQSYGKLGLDFSSSLVDISGDIDIVNGPVLSGGFLFHWDAVRVGCDVAYNTHWEDRDQRAELLDVDVGGSLDGPDWTTSVRTSDLFNNIRLGYVHRVSDVFSIGGQVDYRLKSNYQSLMAGAQWKPDDRTTVKGKLNSDATFSGSLRQRVANFLELIVCAEVDAKELNSSEPRFGLGLEFR